MSNFNRKQKRNKNKGSNLSTITAVGKDFTMIADTSLLDLISKTDRNKSLTAEEKEYCKGFRFDKSTKRLTHTEGTIGTEWLSMWQPSNRSKEIWAIIYGCKPSDL